VRPVCTTPEVDALLTQGSPVAIGVSGGKDSSAVAFAVSAHLDAIRHTGPRLLIHADLGQTEWADSLPTCERLAKRLGLELAIVKRLQGDMMERWEQRWRDNLDRWLNLSCVKLILPWSTPSMRFCTSELKIDQISRYLSRRFEGQQILSVTGVRRDESEDRKNTPICKPQKKLTSKTRKTSGYTWNAIADWTLADVLAIPAEQRFPLHEAYTIFGADRVSCVFCMLGSESSHLAAMKDWRNHPVGQRMVQLEIKSTFAFQGNRWLGDTLNEILPDRARADLLNAKPRAARRVAAEDCIPEDLLYTKGWPHRMPTPDEAAILGDVRLEVAGVLDVGPTFIDIRAIMQRYAELLEEKEASAA
jgi:3'-phosphoadenosine 5'-phosphosulfate sulfotransferase (PAPS reductase)/FAD synthetase